MRQELYRLGKDNALDEGEQVNARYSLTVGTFYGETRVTALSVGLENHVGRIVVESLEPPKRLMQFERNFVIWLGEQAAVKGTEITG